MDGGDGETDEGGSEDSIVFFLKKKIESTGECTLIL
jgi:hypothetical protein